MSAHSCKEESEDIPADSFLGVTVRTDLPAQVVHNFGASDAWSTQFVGKNWPENKREQIADWLFSKEVDADGNPLGIGLSAWRFNIGGGSADQGQASGIWDKWRRAEGFYQPGGELKNNAHEGQRWFLRAAKELGVETFIGFSNSPPVQLTKNGLAYSSGGSSANIDEGRYDAYANFLTNVIEVIRDEDGVTLDYISPFNEPQWNWDNSGQEGSPWLNNEIASITRKLDAVIDSKGVGTLIEIPEAAQLDFLTDARRNNGRDNQIEAFFDPESRNYLGDLSNVANKVAGHSYYTTWDLDRFLGIRRDLNNAVAASGNLEFWMTEYSVLEDNAEINGNGRDLGMHTALYMSRVIFTDLVVANANAWQWWLAVSPYDYKDGLVYIDYNEQDGNIYDSKMLWAMGQFSRFIPSGSKRLEVSRSDLRGVEQTLTGAMVTSFVHPDGENYTVVAINYADFDIPLQVSLRGGSADGWNVYRTSARQDENMSLVNTYRSGDLLDLPSRSITTFVTQIP